MKTDPSDVRAEGDFASRGGMWVVAQWILMVAILFSGPMGGDSDESPGWSRWAGIILLATGAWIGVAGMRELGNSRTPFPKPLENARLVQSGIYALVRHPLYAALIWLGMGWALVFHSPVTAVLAVLQGVFLLTKARREEKWLMEKFPEYGDYSRRVRRFLPLPR
jgi:protein-S-isoprenylcysteine O-methyltransferase Ste14